MIQSKAIIFNTKPIFEKDILVELFTNNVGRIHAFAKYAQSNKPRFGGLLNTFNCVSINLIERKGGFTIKQVQNITSLENLKKNYSNLSLGYKMIEVVKTLTQLNIENESLFELLSNSLLSLDNNNVSNQFLCKFYFSILKVEGLISGEMGLNEKEYKKMIESYTGIKLRNIQ